MSTESEIRDLAELGDNWDGYDGIPISQETIDNALLILSIIGDKPDMDVTPNTQGTISLEWENEQFLCHVEVGVQNFSSFIRLKNGKTLLIDGIFKDA